MGWSTETYFGGQSNWYETERDPVVMIDEKELTELRMTIAHLKALIDSRDKTINITVNELSMLKQKAELIDALNKELEAENKKLNKFDRSDILDLKVDK